ncbi:MAG: hypothetical protein K6G75_08240 [Lachnospiraceae bacterium]|nr:hypothetical protein [Lachnospiraceae bacterium]
MKEPITKDVLDELNNAKTTKEGLSIIENKVEAYPDMTFKNFFDNYLAAHQNITLAEIINRSNVSRNYAYEVIGGKKKGGRDKIIALCFAAGMNYDETNHALKYSGNNELYAKNNRDAIIIFAFNMMNNNNPDCKTIMQLNELLSKRNCAELDI